MGEGEVKITAGLLDAARAGDEAAWRRPAGPLVADPRKRATPNPRSHERGHEDPNPNPSSDERRHGLRPRREPCRRPFLYAPGPGDLPVIEVETLVGIQDSVAKVARDSFFVSIHNSAGDFIAGVRFANSNPSFGIWREDGVAAHDTGFGFFRGELHLLALRIDLPANTWSAWLLGDATLPLFENAPFSAAGLPVDFGHLAYEWLVTAALPAGHGDNWMLVADAVVRRVPRGSEPFRITSCTRLAGTTTVTWPGEPGFDYQVWHSADGAQWLDTLPGSSFPGITTAGPLGFADPEPAARRFYRVVRSNSP